jgi:hypothetical protein
MSRSSKSVTATGEVHSTGTGQHKRKYIVVTAHGPVATR